MPGSLYYYFFKKCVSCMFYVDFFSDEDQVSQSSQDGSLSGSRDSSMERDWSGAGWSETRGSSDNSPDGALPGDDGKITPRLCLPVSLFSLYSLCLSLILSLPITRNGAILIPIINY